MKVRLKNRVKSQIAKRNTMLQLLDAAGYAILAFAALLLSAVFSDWERQFLVLAVVLGMKWIFRDSAQVIQIFTHEENY